MNFIIDPTKHKQNPIVICNYCDRQTYSDEMEGSICKQCDSLLTSDPAPTKEELGMFQVVGYCRMKGCGAMIYVEEYRAMNVVRPKLIYTCEDYCLGRYEDVVWSPKMIGVGIDLPKEESNEENY